jgi:para-aminobenzoate synthetase/4-amino-4-deoxychorismate lyase
MRGTLREGTPRDLFAALQRFQPGTYAACIDTGAQQVLSASPELFFDWQADGSILTRPMKGVARQSCRWPTSRLPWSERAQGVTAP